ncbi:DddA-like double-stranded DNA deaminase toxin [Lentzea californiensis]|uniref:DddA-like double-stranded DNA deaminase toxin n=1 Tax=Lentzea californiensis TaxID=438851 RepID=UPI00216444AB|nr:DddA-like double-stranded DNA deaminase toxin [Lentzea californiensis]MCR3746113.1 SCP1.201-like deaminase [Lentzea californiensis]
MASLGDVADALRRVLGTIDQSITAHHQASELAEHARELLRAASSGSNQTDVEQACSWFTRVIEGITEPEGQVSTLATIADEIRSYLRRHGLAEEACLRQPSQSIAEQVEALRRQLPPPVQAGSGQKTHGRWFTPGSEEARSVVSGEDAESAEVWHVLKDTQFPEKGPPITITHVETKLAVRMRRENIRHASVVINYTPCRMKWGCDNLLPVLLPEGYTLTVYGPNYRKTFTGGKRPPWQR